MDLSPESVVVKSYVPSLGQRSLVYRKRPGQVKAVVIHTTGSGPGRRILDKSFAAWRAKWPQFADDPYEAAKWAYMYGMKSGPHYLIGQDGSVVQMARENYAAWHVGSSGAKFYRLPKGLWHTKDTGWWKTRFPSLSCPLQLADGKLWDGWSCNENTIGIEVVPPLQEPRASWSMLAWDTLSTLVTDICMRHNLPISKHRILSHSDCHPRSRSIKGQPWDPGPKQWDYARFISLIDGSGS